MMNLKSGVNVVSTYVDLRLANYSSCRLLKAGVIGSRYTTYVKLKIASKEGLNGVNR